MGAAGKGWWRWGPYAGQDIERSGMNYKAYGVRMDMGFGSWVTALGEARKRPVRSVWLEPL